MVFIARRDDSRNRGESPEGEESGRPRGLNSVG